MSVLAFIQLIILLVTAILLAPLEAIAAGEIVMLGFGFVWNWGTQFEELQLQVQRQEYKYAFLRFYYAYNDSLHRIFPWKSGPAFILFRSLAGLWVLWPLVLLLQTQLP